MHTIHLFVQSLAAQQLFEAFQDTHLKVQPIGLQNSRWKGAQRTTKLFIYRGFTAFYSIHGAVDSHFAH